MSGLLLLCMLRSCLDLLDIFCCLLIENICGGFTDEFCPVSTRLHGFHSARWKQCKITHTCNIFRDQTHSQVQSATAVSKPTHAVVTSYDYGDCQRSTLLVTEVNSQHGRLFYTIDTSIRLSSSASANHDIFISHVSDSLKQEIKPAARY